MCQVLPTSASTYFVMHPDRRFAVALKLAGQSKRSAELTWGLKPELVTTEPVRGPDNLLTSQLVIFPLNSMLLGYPEYPCCKGAGAQCANGFGQTECQPGRQQIPSFPLSPRNHLRLQKPLDRTSQAAIVRETRSTGNILRDHSEYISNSESQIPSPLHAVASGRHF